MAFQELLNGHELIARHTNSVKELPSKGFKEFTPNNSWLEKKRIENQLEEKFNFIKSERIEKSTCVSQAEWVPDLKKAKVIKKIGKSWETLGHHLDNDDWLFPEEALFLIENCELQLFCDSVCVSVEDFYTLVFHEAEVSLDEYRVYAYLSRAGLKVVRHSPSVSATYYEKQVKLDSIIQMQRRSPPRTTPKENITFIDDDISIVEEPKPIENNSVQNTTDTLNVSETSAVKPVEIIIEIDDEPEVKESNEVVIKDIDSDSDSDIVCISSPSYVSEMDSRSWYPILQKSLRKPIESLIDLSVDDDIVDDKSRVQSTIDLVKVSKADILSNVLSAKNGVSLIKVPDRRLLPPNVFPRYSEYKVNLNIKSENQNQVWSDQNNAISNGGFQVNNMGMPMGMANNPLLMKAREMQMMAMSMIQTAASLMSVAHTANQNPNELWNINYSNNMQAIAQNNPNELWNMCGNRNAEMSSFNSNIPIVNHIRPRFWHPRRNYPRRRRGQDRRYPWSPRRTPRFDSPYLHHDREIRSSLEPCASTEIVILSDDEDHQGFDKESKLGSLKKRKQNGELELNKRLKTEDEVDCDSVVISENSFTMEDLPSSNSSVKKENTEVLPSASSSVKIEISGDDGDELKSKVKTECSSVIKTESVDNNSFLKGNLEIDPSKLNGAHENQYKIVPESIGGENFILEQSVLEQPHKLKDNPETSNKNAFQESTSLPEECVNNNLTQEKVDDRPISSGSNVDMELEQGCSNSISECENLPKVSPKGKELSEEIVSWEQLKNRPDVYEDDIESLIKLDQCQNYGQVLTALQIFKPFEVKQVTKKFKISFDAYLPDSNFKKKLKVLPNYRVIILKSGEELPNSFDIEGLKAEYQDNIPFLFSIVFEESITFFLYDTVSLNTFYE